MAVPQIILMTGCSSGIGLATAERLARDPDQRFLVIATVISSDLKGDLVAAVGDALDKTVFIKEMDVTKDDQISAVIDDVIKQHGRIDILLNIAGVCCSGILETIPRDQISLTFEVNTIGVIRLTQRVLPYMKSRKAGKIITVTSRAGRIGTPLLAVYSASKFATEGFMESIASTARKFQIWISIVEPGLVQTSMMDGIVSNVGADVDNESINDIDRNCARAYVDQLKPTPKLATTDVAAKLLEVIEAEKPVLRYPIPEEALRESLLYLMSDTTGERAVARQLELITENA